MTVRKVVKGIGAGLGGLLVIVVLLAAVVYARSNTVIRQSIAVVQPPLAIPTDSASLARGRHLVTGVSSCTDCHGEHLGGTLMIDAPPFMRLAAPNLTAGAGGSAARLADADWVRAIRHGLGPDGRALAVMPSSAYQYLSDADLGAVIAYVKSVPPVDHLVPPRSFGPVARVQLARGTFPLFRVNDVDHGAAQSVSAPPAAVTAEYGRYLARIAGCTDCHGPGLSGGPVAAAPPHTPPAANITPSAIGGWTDADFVRAVREGKGTGGRQLDPFMPYRYFAFTDDELQALWLFVRSVPPRPFGNR
jgi:mono/diheme cytochrome c family protein